MTRCRNNLGIGVTAVCTGECLDTVGCAGGGSCYNTGVISMTGCVDDDLVAVAAGMTLTINDIRTYHDVIALGYAGSRNGLCIVFRIGVCDSRYEV